MKGGGFIIRRGLSRGRCLLEILGYESFNERGRVMAKRMLLVGLLGISLIALIGNEALAACCILRYSSGSCKVWSSSVGVQINASGLGNVSKNDAYFAFTAETGPTSWVLACGNHGSKKNIAPGVNLVYADESISEAVPISKTDVDRNGLAIKTLVGTPDLAPFYGLEESVCPNPNWEIVNAVPCNINTLTDKIWQVVQGGTNDGKLCETGTATFNNCYLPDCETLTIDKTTGHFEYREYVCDEPIIVNYTQGNEICPPPGYVE
jgi:hypothetical protein